MREIKFRAWESKQNKMDYNPYGDEMMDFGSENAPIVERLVEVKWVEATCGFRDAVAVADGEVIGNIYENPNLLAPQEPTV